MPLLASHVISLWNGALVGTSVNPVAAPAAGAPAMLAASNTARKAAIKEMNDRLWRCSTEIPPLEKFVSGATLTASANSDNVDIHCNTPGIYLLMVKQSKC